jgi:hypothetical protein
VNMANAVVINLTDANEMKRETLLQTFLSLFIHIYGDLFSFSFHDH